MPDRSLPECDTECKIITARRGIQLNPLEFAFLSQYVDPLHSLIPLYVRIERSPTSLLLAVDCRRVKLHILLDVGHLPGSSLLVEMCVKLLEQVADG